LRRRHNGVAGVAAGLTVAALSAYVVLMQIAALLHWLWLRS
jgi:hypothetical protein